MTDLNTSIMHSFLPKDTLNPKVWINFRNPENSKINNDIRINLLYSAYEFMNSLDIDLKLNDVIIVGSMAGFNWSKYSDFDVHLLVDFTQFKPDAIESIKSLFNVKKKLFDIEHEIKIKGYNVECYVQSIDEKNESTGVYSLFMNKWITLPQKKEIKISRELLGNEIKKWKKIIFDVIKKTNINDVEKSRNLIDDTFKRLRTFRKKGLERANGGEFSIENLTFKYLRRSNIIKKLFDEKANLINQSLSMEQINEQTGGDFLFWLGKIMAYLGIGEDETDNKKELAERIAKLITEGKAILMNEKTKEYNESTKTIQMILLNLGYSLPLYGADGRFGDETKKKIVEFQKNNNLPETGMVETGTMKKMLSKLRGDGDVSKSPTTKINTSVSENAKKSFEFFINKGLTPEQATGIMGNLQEESGFDPSINGDYIKKYGGYTSYGIAQWHRNRKTNLRKFCDSRKEKISDIDCQLEFLWFELTTKYKGTLNKIKNSATPEESAHYFADEFEIPANKDYNKRKNYARGFFQSLSEENV